MKPCLSPDPLEEPPPAGQQSSCKFQEQREKNKVRGIILFHFNTNCCGGGNVVLAKLYLSRQQSSRKVQEQREINDARTFKNTICCCVEGGWGGSWWLVVEPGPVEGFFLTGDNIDID